MSSRRARTREVEHEEGKVDGDARQQRRWGRFGRVKTLGLFWRHNLCNGHQWFLSKCFVREIEHEEKNVD